MADPVEVKQEEAVVVVPVKSPLVSKTVWFNLILALAAFSQPAEAFVQEHGSFIAMMIPVVGNIVLRFVSKDKVSFTD